MGKNVKVVVRVRTPSKSRIQEPTELVCDIKKNTVHVRMDSVSENTPISKVPGFQRRRVFQFDKVFESSTQEEFFENADCRSMLNFVKRGFNATIIAYGQTGAGKTYTIEGIGEAQDMGIVPRLIKLLFEDKVDSNQHRKEESTILKCSYVQIYNERCYDLLNPNLNYHAVNRVLSRNNKKNIQMPSGYLKLRWSSSKGFYLENMSKIILQDAIELQHWYNYGNLHKITAEHKLNVSSSRSHTLFTLYVRNTNRSHEGRLRVVDLAGSERISSTEAEGVTLVESIGINKSLHVLNKVIMALSSQRSSSEVYHVPYRDSLLTSLLQSAFGGNSITLLVACLSPNGKHSEENLSTLRYASQATFIENQPKINIDPAQLKINSMKSEILELKQRLAQHNDIGLACDQYNSKGAKQPQRLAWSGKESKLRTCLNTYSRVLQTICNDNKMFLSYSGRRNCAPVRQRKGNAFCQLRDCLYILEHNIETLEQNIVQSK